MTTTMQHGHEPDLNSPCAECVRQGEVVSRASARAARSPLVDRLIGDAEAIVATRQTQSYVFEASVQCRARACTFVHYVGENRKAADAAEIQARRHAAETGHEVEVLIHRVRAYARRKR